jgi:hypothetical protein
MPLTNVTPAARMSDLVVHENDPSVGFSRESINVTAADAVTFGKIYFRVKGIDPAGAYAVLSNTSQLVLTNEFVVVFGDKYGFTDSFTAAAIVAGQFNAVGFKRDVILKDEAVRLANVSIIDNAAKLDTAREVLKVQGIILEKTITMNFA